MFDIVALGELLIDFTDGGYSQSGMKLFERNAGGAPCNMLTAATRMGRSTAFIGKVGNDMHGQFLRQVIESEGICTKGLVMDSNVFTTLAFVALDARGEREFSFARKPGADICLKSDEVSRELLQNCKVFHFGSLSLTNEPTRTASFVAVNTAKEAGAVISYDPNYREKLWPDQESARFHMQSVLQYVDMIKVSDEELEIVTGEQSLENACAFHHSKGVTCVAITLGKKGAYVSLNEKGGGFSDSVELGKTIDKTGAGDAFWGAFISYFIKEGKSLVQLSIADVIRYADQANIVAALSISKRGGIPSMPYLKEVEHILQHQEKESNYESQ